MIVFFVYIINEWFISPTSLDFFRNKLLYLKSWTCNPADSNSLDKDLNVFFGIDKELNRSFSLLIEYDAALNDNDNKYELDDITFGKDKGYLNAGLRWVIMPNVMMEINFNDINKKTEADYTRREIKIMYSESF